MESHTCAQAKTNRNTPIFEGVRPFLASLAMWSTTSSEVCMFFAHCNLASTKTSNLWGVANEGQARAANTLSRSVHATHGEVLQGEHEQTTPLNLVGGKRPHVRQPVGIRFWYYLSNFPSHLLTDVWQVSTRELIDDRWCQRNFRLLSLLDCICLHM